MQNIFIIDVPAFDAKLEKTDGNPSIIMSASGAEAGKYIFSVSL